METWDLLYKWAEKKGINIFPISILIAAVYIYWLIKNERAARPRSLCTNCKYRRLIEDEIITTCDLYKKGHVISFIRIEYCPHEMKIINGKRSIL